MTSKPTIKKNPTPRNRWFERFVALVALINLGLVLFDLSYVPWRNFYLSEIPGLTQLYDPLKGIEPHRETQDYLAQVNELEAQVLLTGLASPEVEPLLANLRRLSDEMIEDNPFAVASKSGTLEKIKNQIRLRVTSPAPKKQIKKTSSHEAFDQFWSQSYLAQRGWQQEIAFFDTTIRPEMETNYYRDISENGKFVDHFWLLDAPFVALFSLEFLARTFYLSRKHPYLSWLQAMLRRWYDIFLLLPFWRWLRMIPVTIRLYQTELLDLSPIQEQINHDFVANFAEELTEVIGVRMISQAQESIRRGEITRWLFHPETRRPYLQINETDEVKAIATRLVNLSVYDVLPQIQPDIEAVVHHSLGNTLRQAPLYQQLQNIPGLDQLPTQLTERLAKDLSQSACDNLIKAVEDPVGSELISRLLTNFKDALETELQKSHNMQEIQTLLVDMLEEIKINYVKGIEEAGIAKILEETEQLHQLTYK